MNDTKGTHHWIRNTLLIILGIALLIGSTYRIWLPRAMALSALYATRGKPVQAIPVLKQLNSSVPLVHEYTFDGIAFQVPWNDLSYERGTTTQALYFGTNTDRHIVVAFPALPDEPLAQDEKGVQFFGSDLKTNYGSYREAAHVTPHDIDLFASPKVFLPKAILLIDKSVIIPGWPSYEFTNANGVRGFEYVSSATSTLTEYFTPNDVHHTLLIKGATIEESDAILQSLREVSAAGR